MMFGLLRGPALATEAGRPKPRSTRVRFTRVPRRVRRETPNPIRTLKCSLSSRATSSIVARRVVAAIGMIDWIFLPVLIGSGLVMASALTSTLAFRFGAPLLLIFLMVGLLAGEDGLGIRYDDAASAYLIGSLALAIILFDSGTGCSPLPIMRKG